MADTTHLESELSSMNTTTTTTKEEGPASLSQHVSIILSTIYGMRAIQQQIIVIIVGIVLTLFLSLGRQHSYDRSLPLASWQDWNPWCRGQWLLLFGNPRSVLLKGMYTFLFAIWKSPFCTNGDFPMLIQIVLVICILCNVFPSHLYEDGFLFQGSE